MTGTINLKEMKRQIYLFYSEDGLADLAIGLMIFGFGMMLLVDLPVLVSLLGVAAYLVWYLGKEFLVVPRIGTIQPDQALKNRFRGFFITLVLLGLGVFTLFVMSKNSGQSFLRQHPLTLFGLVLALGISSLGIVLKTSRFYLYGLLVFGAMAIGEALTASITIVDTYLVSVICAGGIILVIGFSTLARFLNKYPVVSLED